MKMRKPRSRLHGFARLALSFAVALLIIDALGALGFNTETGSCCFLPDPGPGGGGPTPTSVPVATATPDPLYPWDTYPRQGFTDQQVASYAGDFGVQSFWFHGYVDVTGTIMNVDEYAYDISGVVTGIVLTHGATAKFSLVPNIWEYIYGGGYNTPLISINGTLDGCEDPYPTPVAGGCIHGAIPNDPYGANGDDFAYSNFASFPAYPVFSAHGLLDMNADALPGDGVSQVNTHNPWKHRVVYPAIGS